MNRMTRKEITKAVRRYARKYGFTASTVRVCTSLRTEALQEYREVQAPRPVPLRELRAQGLLSIAC